MERWVLIGEGRRREGETVVDKTGAKETDLEPETDLESDEEGKGSLDSTVLLSVSLSDEKRRWSFLGGTGGAEVDGLEGKAEVGSFNSDALTGLMAGEEEEEEG